MNNRNIDVLVGDMPVRLILGRRGENFAVHINFNLVQLIEQYGDGIPELLHMRKGDIEPYPVALEWVGNIATWNVSAADTAVSGVGSVEMRWYVGDMLAKSIRYETVVTSAMPGTQLEPPEAQQGWVDSILQTAAQTALNAKNAASSAELADNAKNVAEAAKNTADERASDAEIARGEVITAKNDAVIAALEAANNAGEAAASESAAAISALRAGASETNAANSETAAESSAVSAQTSATNAANSSTQAMKAAQSILNSGEQLTTNTSDIGQLKETIGRICTTNTVIGKNHLDKSTVTDGLLFDADGKLTVVNASYVTSDFIELPYNPIWFRLCSYNESTSLAETVGIRSYAYYDADKNVMKASGSSATPYGSITDANVNYIRISFLKTSIDSTMMMFSSNSSAEIALNTVTEYTPYIEETGYSLADGLTTYQEEQLKTAFSDVVYESANAAIISEFAKCNEKIDAIPTTDDGSLSDDVTQLKETLGKLCTTNIIIGKNHLDKSTVTNDLLFDADGNLTVVNTSYVTSDFIELPYNPIWFRLCSYNESTSLAETVGIRSYAYYDADKNVMKASGSSATPYGSITDANVKYIRISFTKTSIDSVMMLFSSKSASEIALDTMSEYIPYIEETGYSLADGLTTYQEEQLKTAFSDVVYESANAAIISEFAKCNEKIDAIPNSIGVKWIALGDSITQGYYSYIDDSGTPASTWGNHSGWVYRLQEMNGFTLTNAGLGGTGYAHTKNSNVSARQLVDTLDFSEYNLVTLAFGVNDWKYKEVLGSMEDDVQTGTSIYACMRYVLEKIILDNPLCKIIVITPINCGYGNESSNWGLSLTYENNGTLEDIFYAESEVCEYYGIEMIDMTHSSIVNRKNIKQVLLDNVHPTIDCHMMMARELFKRINFN